MNITYRTADIHDASALIEYMHCVGAETDNLTYGKDTFNISVKQEERFIERFSRSGRDIMLVALDGDNIIALASVEANKIKRFSHRAELSITVRKAYWGQGIGSALMRMLIAFAKDTQIEVLYLDVRADNERAISLYKKFGFSEISHFEKYFKIGNEYFDGKIMTLYI